MSLELKPTNDLALVAQIKTCLEPLRMEILRILLKENEQMQSCGYSASIVTTLLKKTFPTSKVRIGYGYVRKPNSSPYSAPEQTCIFHFWTEIDDKVAVDATWSQFTPDDPAPRLIVEPLNEYIKRLESRFDRNEPENFSDLGNHHYRTLEDLCLRPDDTLIPNLENALGAYRSKFSAAIKWLSSLLT